MKIARYWERQTISDSRPDGQTIKVSGWGWSTTDVDEARSRARDPAKRVLCYLTSGQFLPFDGIHGWH